MAVRLKPFREQVVGASSGIGRECALRFSVTSVEPGTVNAPFFDNPLNERDVQPKGPPPCCTTAPRLGPVGRAARW